MSDFNLSESEESEEEEESDDQSDDSEEDMNERQNRRAKATERIKQRREQAERNRTTDVLRAGVVCVLGNIIYMCKWYNVAKYSKMWQKYAINIKGNFYIR